MLGKNIKDFFTIKEIASGVYCIQETFFKEKANLFLIRGATHNLLIDCGLGIANIKMFLSECKIDNLKLFITHAHFDHAGGIGQFLPEELILTKQVFRNLRNRKLWGLEYLCADQLDSHYLSELNHSPEEVCREFNITIPNTVSYQYKEISLGNRSFEIISLPGHTDDSVVLYDRTNKLLFSGDVLYDGEIYCDLPNSNKHDFLASLLFLKDLEVNTLFSGHNDPPKINEVDYRRCLESWIKKLREGF